MKINYDSLERKMKKKYLIYYNLVRKISIFRLIDFILIIVFISLTSLNNNLYYLYLVLTIISIILFIILIFIHDKYYKKEDYYSKYLSIIDEYNLRINGKWNKLKNTGSEYINDNNKTLQDLDIIGNSSLYQYLCCCRTLQGKKLLYDNLNNIELDNHILLDRQEQVKEIANNMDFIINYQVYLLSVEDNMNMNRCFDKLTNIRNDYFIILTIFGNAISVIPLILGLFSIISIKYVIGIIILKYLFSYLYCLIYRDYFNNINVISSNASKLKDIYGYISNISFNNSSLKKIVNNISNGLNIISELDSVNTFSKLKDNFIANFIFNGIFTIDPYVLYFYYKFKNSNSSIFNTNINNIAYLECLISLSTIAVTKDDISIPIIIEEVELDFNGIRHPLLDSDICISNSFKLNNNINIITGSNMSGKTSFLRTIGINIILANAGTYVNCEYFKVPYLKVFTSMRVQDDLEHGISTFYGELLRIKDAIEYEKKNMPMIVLMDEIFKGTNYNDRIEGAISVMKKLNNKNVILFITTHDFELCDSDILKIDNYYFSEYYEDDNIKFDYLIKKGKCTTTNAKYLMERLGILEKKEN